MTDAMTGAAWTDRLDVLRRRRQVVFWVALALVVLGEAFVLGLPSLYRASATLLVQGQVPEAFVQQLVQGEINTRLQAIKQEALSRARLTELLSRFDLYGVSQGQTTPEVALARLQRDIKVEPTSTEQNPNGRAETISFRVSYVGASPQTAADVTNALASFWVAQNDQMRAQQASHATDVLSAQLADTRAKLEEQQKRVQVYTSRHTGGLPQQMEANLSAMNRLDGQMRINGEEQMRLLERRQNIQNELSQLDLRPPPAPADPNSPDGRLAAAQKELADMRAKGWQPTHPDMKAQLQQVETLKREVAAAPPKPAPSGPSPRATLEQSLNEVNGQLKKIASDNTTLSSQIGAYQSRVESAPAREPEFDSLLRDYQSTRDRLDSLQKRYDEAQLSERAERGRDTTEFKILDAAVPPQGPTGPAKVLLVGGVLLFALIAGVVVGLIADRADTSFHSLDDLRQFTAVPILACIPEIASRQGRAQRKVRFAVVTAVSIVALAVLAGAAYRLAGHSDQIVRLLSRVG
jgi:polysaccharide chain length determinant protein (PEP-CTERM system associated)